jgi:hypothetical protein
MRNFNDFTGPPSLNPAFVEEKKKTAVVAPAAGIV